MDTATTITLVIADDHPIVLQGLRRLFSEQPDFNVVAACASGAEALDAVRRLGPQVLLIDLQMDGVSGLDALKTLHGEQTSSRVVILTGAMRDDEVAEAVRFNVSGLMLKDSSPEAVVECVRRVAAGEQWIRHQSFTRALADAVRNEASPTPQSTLTPRELEIVRLAAQGLRNKEIAARLSITEGTVKIHLHNVYDKLGVDSRTELLLAAQHKHLL